MNHFFAHYINIKWGSHMTPRERFIKALLRQPLSGRVPHFELVFYLTMEAFEKVHPTHRHFGQWAQMSELERQLQREDIARTYIMAAEKYEHSAIFVQADPGAPETFCIIDEIRKQSGDTYFIMLHGDTTFAIPDGNSMVDFSMRMVDDPEGLQHEAQRNVDHMISVAKKWAEHGGLDGFALCSDYCLNTGPFMSPRQFAKFVTPYLKQTIDAYRELGLYTIKHTDGNIMPIIDQLVACGPDALHSIDPQAGVDIAEVKRLYGDKICVIGNVNCGLLQNGTDEQVVENVRYALHSGMPGGGYVFSTSNCVYTGMDLSRYELMLDVWRREGNYA